MDQHDAAKLSEIGSSINLQAEEKGVSSVVPMNLETDEKTDKIVQVSNLETEEKKENLGQVSVISVPIVEGNEVKVTLSSEAGSNIMMKTELEAFQKAWGWTSNLIFAIQAIEKTRPNMDPMSKTRTLEWTLGNRQDAEVYSECLDFFLSEAIQATEEVKKFSHVIKRQMRTVKANSEEKLVTKIKQKKKAQVHKEPKEETKVAKIESHVDEDSDWEDNTDMLAIQHKTEREILKKRKREEENPLAKIKDIKEPVAKKRKIDEESMIKFQQALQKEKESKKSNTLPKLQCPFIMSTLRSNYSSPFNLVILEFGLNKQTKTVLRNISEKRTRTSDPLFQKVTRCAWIGDHIPSFLRPDFIIATGISKEERLTLLNYWASDYTGIVAPNQRYKAESTCILHNLLGPAALTLITSKSSCNTNRGFYVSFPKEHAGLIVAHSTASDGKINWDSYKRTSEKRVLPAPPLDVAAAKQLIEKYNLQNDFKKDCQRTPLERVYRPITPAEQRGAGAPGDADEPGLGTWEDEFALRPRKYLSATKAKTKQQKPIVTTSKLAAPLLGKSLFGKYGSFASGLGESKPMFSPPVLKSAPEMPPASCFPFASPMPFAPPFSAADATSSLGAGATSSLGAGAPMMFMTPVPSLEED